MPPLTRSARDSRAHCAEECARGVTSTTGLDTFPLAELVAVAKFGEPIYPYLEKLDELEHGGGDLWHALIQADNYHALQLLEYLYAGQVDCIYIDPPYNTGAKDWKYNNDYVDSNDCYRHSKWLSMMERRLKIAKCLLNPKDSVLIVTIDEKEYLHLGMLLEQMFPEARIQMVSIMTNPKGVARGGFRRCDEYAYFVMMGVAVPARLDLPIEWSPSITQILNSDNIEKNVGKEKQEPGWSSMMRRGTNSRRSDRPGLYYAIYVDPVRGRIVPDAIGSSILEGKHRDKDIEGLIQVLPIRASGEEGRWQIGPSELKLRIEQGRIRLGRPTSYGYVVNYLSDGEYEEVMSGKYCIVGRAEDNSLIAYRNCDGDDDNSVAPAQWKIAGHNASENGSTLIGKIIGKRFSFPKSLYAVHDAIRFFVANKPNALILDFFAGSGTTLHAVNLLNAEDGGKRRCILVTNNEVSNDEAAAFRKRGLNPGDAEWEARGIAQYVTWPRTTCSIRGVNVKGAPLKGEYIISKTNTRNPASEHLSDEGQTFIGHKDQPLPMAEGFKANAVFFKLGFLDPGAVSMGRRFKELLPLLWMKAGEVGKCPAWGAGGQYRIWTENRMAVLFDEGAFAREVKAQPEIMTVYLTDYEPSFRAMAKSFPRRRVYQLYRDYRDNFRLNQGGRS